MNRANHYEIHIEEELTASWSDWLDGLTIKSQPGEETILSGILPDQAALLGILNKVHDLNLTITLVKKEG